MGYSKRPGIAIFLVTIMLLAPIAGVMGTAGASSGPGEEDPTDELDIDIWMEAPLSLAADPAGASESVDLPAIGVDTSDTFSPLERDEIGVYETDADIPFTFGDHSNVDASEFDGNDDIKVVRAQFDESADGAELDPSSVPMTEAELLGSFTQENLEALNGNATVTIVEEPEIEDGEFTFSDSTDEPGVYTYFVVDGLEADAVEDGDIAPTTEMKLLGAEQVAVHEEPSTVDVAPSSPEPGDDVTVDVDATALEGDVDHAVVLYDSDTFSSSEMVVNITDELNTDLSAENVSLEHEIEAIDTPEMSEPVSVADVIAFLGAETEFDTGDVVTPDEGEGETLEVATNGTIDDPNTEIVLGTGDDWDGDYQLVHVAMETSSDQFQVGTEEVTIEEETGTGPSPSPPTDPDPDKPEAVISIDPDPAEVGEEITFSGAESTADRPIVDYEWEIAGETYHGETVTTAFDKPGAYDVELVVSTGIADSEPETTKVTVTGPPDDTPADDEKPVDDDDDPTIVDDDPADDPADDDADDSIPGFGVAATLVAVLSLAVLALRRQH